MVVFFRKHILAMYLLCAKCCQMFGKKETIARSYSPWRTFKPCYHFSDIFNISVFLSILLHIVIILGGEHIRSLGGQDRRGGSSKMWLMKGMKSIFFIENHHSSSSLDLWNHPICSSRKCNESFHRYFWHIEL